MVTTHEEDARPMFHLLIDTCVWLDLAKERKELAIVSVIQEMVKRGLLTLVVLRVVVDEFRRNRGRIASESVKSVATHFRLVKDAVKTLRAPIGVG